MSSDSSDQMATHPEVPLLELLGIFLRVGILAIGGGTQAFMHREIVEQRGWLDEKAYLTGFAIAQVLPGANPVNLALYLGLKLRGGIGAAVAVFGMVVPAFCIILMMGFAYRQVGGFPATHSILVGVAAVGVAATLSVGIKVARHMERNGVAPVIALVVFTTIGLLHWPMVPVVLVAVPISILLAFWMERRDAR
jgi:chromate transporter